MTVSRGVGNILLTAAGAAIVIVTIVIIASLLGSDTPVDYLISKSLELRKAQDPVQRAQLITEIDDIITNADSSELLDQWNRMMGCLATSCPNEAYLDLVLVTTATFEDDLPQSALLINVIATAKYWGDPEHLLEFSRALSMANEDIEELASKKTRNAWQDVVECNNTCPEKDDLLFDLIETLVQ
ncbi:hypothetical protein J4219_06540 [Candidatus Woesearchaeota archaeon]|nr:hypothetical protein [Candidatus Woesearchaeota archaeon]